MRFLAACFSLLLIGILVCAGVSPAWAETDRRFAQTLCLEYLDEWIIPVQEVEGTTVGGLSAIAYDRTLGKLYALSDEHGGAETHFYTLDLQLDESGERPKIGAVTVEGVTFLTDETGNRYGGTFDPEGMALTPQGTLYVASEGSPAAGLAPGLTEFDLKTGRQLRALPVPSKFQPQFETPSEPEVTATDTTPTPPEPTPLPKPRQTAGVQTNQGFESLTLGFTGTAAHEPIRLFTATEGPLVQDKTAGSINSTPRNRFLHYYLGEGPPLLLAEHLYQLDTAPGAMIHGLSELLALDDNGHFLALERSLTPLGFQIKLFQISLAGASDISTRPSLRENLRGVQPMQKQLLLNLSDLGITLDNLEGMAWGPQLADGSRSLLMISDDNFKSFEKTQLLLFRVQLQP